jgi:hypothetical protein
MNTGLKASPGRVLVTAYDELIGEELSGIAFVRDYVQLQFNSLPELTALTPITVASGSASATLGNPDFANLAIGQIGRSVGAIDYRESNILRLIFEDGSVVSISLEPDDYTGPEAVNFRRRDGSMVVE